jgi:hypothetical protein
VAVVILSYANEFTKSSPDANNIDDSIMAELAIINVPFFIKLHLIIHYKNLV